MQRVVLWRGGVDEPEIGVASTPAAGAHKQPGAKRRRCSAHPRQEGAGGGDGWPGRTAILRLATLLGAHADAASLP